MSVELLFGDEKDVAANCRRINENESEGEIKAKQTRILPYLTVKNAIKRSESKIKARQEHLSQMQISRV